MGISNGNSIKYRFYNLITYHYFIVVGFFCNKLYNQHIGVNMSSQQRQYYIDFFFNPASIIFINGIFLKSINI